VPGLAGFRQTRVCTSSSVGLSRSRRPVGHGHGQGHGHEDSIPWDACVQFLDIYWRHQYSSNMKTIAVTIDEPTLHQVDRLLSRDSGVGSSRSALVRQALQDYLHRLSTREAEQEERRIWRRHRQKLERQAAALVDEQATP